MKNINISLDDIEYQLLVKKKKTLSWKSFILDLAGIVEVDKGPMIKINEELLNMIDSIQSKLRDSGKRVPTTKEILNKICEVPLESYLENLNKN